MINVFNSNYEEIGSLDKNLALHTLGKVKIRYGRKYIDLLNDKGELNVSIPKILQEKDSLENITKDGFYLVDGDLYAYYKGNVYQLTGVEGDYISFAVEQNLTQEQIDIAQNNIGLTFSSLNKVTINKGIVFIDDRIYYKDGNYIKELTLKEPLSSINEADLGTPNSDNVAIVFKNGQWQYSSFVTQDQLDNLKLEIPKQTEREEEEEYDDIFDPIQYSKVYTIKQAELNQSGNNLVINADTIPKFNQTDGDIAIISFEVYKYPQADITTIADPGTTGMAEQNTLYVIKAPYTISRTGQNSKYIINTEKDILTLNFKIDSGALKLCDKNGALINNFILDKSGYLIPNAFNATIENVEEYGSGPFSILKIGNDAYLLENIKLKRKHIYVKAETVDSAKLATKEKFKIDYKNAQIALEENTPGNPLSILPHTVLGNLDDVDKYYKDPAVSFRTYTEKQSKQGLYSDQPVFSGGEFRGRWPTELTSDELVQNFPRYSKKLNDDLCTNHSASTVNIDNANDLWRQVIPTIEWIKRNGAMLNKPLKNINEESRTYLPENPPTNISVGSITPEQFEDYTCPPLAIVYKVDKYGFWHWTYEPVVPFSWFINCCNTEEPKVYTPVISGTESFTESTTVTITCATEGATIYYTTNGTDPTNSSSRYSSPITLSNTATVKAIAYKDQDVSSVASKQFTKLTGEVYTLKFYYYPNNEDLEKEYFGKIDVMQGLTANINSLGIPNFNNYEGELTGRSGQWTRTTAMRDYFLEFTNRTTGSDSQPMTNFIVFDSWVIVNGWDMDGVYIDEINFNNFTDWQSLDNSDTEYNVSSDKNINFYARWKAISYNVTYNFDEGTFNNESQYIEIVNKGKYPTWGNNNHPSKSGYTFTGWSPDLHNTNITSNRTTTAQWTQNTSTSYYLKFYMYPDPDSTIVNELIKDTNNNPILIEVTNGQTANLGNLSNPTISTYQSYSGIEYNGRIKTIRSGKTASEFGYNFNFPTALWEDPSIWPYPETNPSECIKFKHWMYGYGDVTNSNTYNPASNARDRAITSQFTNWESLDAYTYNDNNNNNQKTLNLFAIWEPIYYTVTWNLNGGSLSSADIDKINSYSWSSKPYIIQTQNGNTVVKETRGIKNTHPVWKFDEPTKEGYTFGYWDIPITYVINADVEIYVRWSNNI